jgi:hypothetical protein
MSLLMAESKKCCTCQQVLPSSEFNKRAKAPDGLQSRCRSCCRIWYQNNREAHGVKTRNRSAPIRARLSQQLCDYLLEHPCVDCGEADIRVLDFDHRDPATKVGAVTTMIVTHESWRLIELEIEKCDVRCANCHRRRTAAQFDTRRQRVFVTLMAVREMSLIPEGP